MIKKLNTKYLLTTNICNKLSVVTLLSLALTISLDANRADAQVARISGSATFVNAGSVTVDTATGITTTRTGGISTVSAESVLPTGLFYNGNVAVNPAFSTVSDGLTTSVIVNSLSVGAPGGVSSVSSVTANSTFTSAAAKILIDAAAATASPNIDAIAAIIKAGAGVNGLD